jgi:hypothetical protein
MVARGVFTFGLANPPIGRVRVLHASKLPGTVQIQ